MKTILTLLILCTLAAAGRIIPADPQPFVHDTSTILVLHPCKEYPCEIPGTWYERPYKAFIKDTLPPFDPSLFRKQWSRLSKDQIDSIYRHEMIDIPNHPVGDTYSCLETPNSKNRKWVDLNSVLTPADRELSKYTLDHVVLSGGKFIVDYAWFEEYNRKIWGGPSGKKKVWKEIYACPDGSPILLQKTLQGVIHPATTVPESIEYRE